MQRVIMMLVVATLMGSCNLSNQEEGKGPARWKAEKIISVTIQELLSEPTEYQDKKVAISGMVTHVCRHGGQKCFVLAGDRETQLRILTGEEIDEFETSLEGSTVAFKGLFRILNEEELAEHLEDHDPQEHHAGKMPHSQAERSSYYIEADDYMEVTP